MSSEEVASIDAAYNLAIDQACIALHDMQQRVIINADAILTIAPSIQNACKQLPMTQKR